MNRRSIESGCSIDVSRGSKGENHIRANILTGKDRKVFVSTIVLVDYPDAMAETMAFRINEHGRPETDPDLNNVVFDRYKTSAEAVRGHRRAVYGARRILAGQNYTPKLRLEEEGEMELTPQQAARNAQKEAEKILRKDTISFSADQAMQVLSNLKADLHGANVDLAEVVRKALRDLGLPDSSSEDKGFEEAMRELANTPGLEESNLPENLRPDFCRFRSDKQSS